MNAKVKKYYKHRKVIRDEVVELVELEALQLALGLDECPERTSLPKPGVSTFNISRTIHCAIICAIMNVLKGHHYQSPGFQPREGTGRGGKRAVSTP